MDYGKFKYESALKARESRKNQAQTVIKEIKLRPKIDPHDYGTKKGHVERFLKAGDKVKVTIMFRGREQSRPELGFRLLQRLAGDVEELGFVEAQPKQDGRNMTMVIGPHRRKSDARAERPVHPQAERSHPERPERSPQAHRGPQAQPAQPEPALAAQPEPAQVAQPAQPEPAQAAQPEPAQAAQPEPAQAAQPEPAQAAQPEPAKAAQPAPARPAPARPAPARPAPARPAPAQPAEAQPVQAKPAPAQPAPPKPAAQPAPQPAERVSAARPVPGPRAVHAAAARRANGGQGTRQPGQEVSAS